MTEETDRPLSPKVVVVFLLFLHVAAAPTCLSSVRSDSFDSSSASQSALFVVSSGDLIIGCSCLRSLNIHHPVLGGVGRVGVMMVNLEQGW